MADQFNILDQSLAGQLVVYKTGSNLYYFPQPHAGTSTSAALGNGTLRLSPVLVPKTLIITRLGAEVLATVGEAGSVFRLGIYADNGQGYPGALVVDGGTIDGTSATVQEVTVAVTLGPGLYWVGGAIQAAPTTQPNMRLATTLNMGGGGGLPTAAGAQCGYTQGSVTGALPATFSTSVANAGSVPRFIWKAQA